MTDLLLVLLINFFALYTTSQYLAVLKKEEQKKSISEWLEQFRKLIFSENRPLYEYDVLLSEYHYNFDEFEKN